MPMLSSQDIQHTATASIIFSILKEFVIYSKSIDNSDGTCNLFAITYQFRRNLFAINCQFHVEFVVYFESISNTFESVSILPDICNFYRTNYQFKLVKWIIDSKQIINFRCNW